MIRQRDYAQDFFPSEVSWTLHLVFILADAHPYQKLSCVGAK